MEVAMAAVGFAGKVGAFLPRLGDGSADGEVM